MEVLTLETYIAQRLTNLSGINVYNRVAPDTATFPYLVFKLNACNYIVRHRKDWILELDFWNDSNDDSSIKQSAIYVKTGRTVGENIYIGLDNSTQSEAEGFYQCHIEFEGTIEDIENDISRYNQRYIIKLD